MKTLQSLQLAVVSLALVGTQSQGALMNLVQPGATDPYYADFKANSLKVTYTYNNVTGIGTLTAANVGTVGEAYESGSASAGTGSGSGRPTGFNNQTFTGSYSLTASIQQLSGVWSVTGGTFTMKGNLLGGTSADLLLKGNLVLGGDGPAGAWGYLNGSKLFEFLYTVDTGNSANGNSAIRKDFNTDNALPGTVRGGIKLNLNNAFGGSFTTAWSNAGFADTFVPEPGAYAWAGGAMAAGVCLIRARRSSFRQREQQFKF